MVLEMNHRLLVPTSSQSYPVQGVYLDFLHSNISLTVAHTEAGKNWRGLFRVDPLKEKVENPGLSYPRFNPGHRHSPCLLSPCRIALGLRPCLCFALSQLILLLSLSPCLRFALSPLILLWDVAHGALSCHMQTSLRTTFVTGRLSPT